MKIKSFCGRVMILPLYTFVLIGEIICRVMQEKGEDFKIRLRKNRFKIEKWSDKHFPLRDGKKTNLY